MLTVEDGSVVANANSYCDTDFIKHYCVTRGLELPSSDDVINKAAVLAMNYIESKKDQYQGHITDASQILSFPRKLLRVNGYEHDADSIPVVLKYAQAHATYLVCDDVDLQPFVDGSFLSEAKLGPLAAKFSQNTVKDSNGENYFTPVDDYLKQLIKKDYGYRLTKRHGF